MLKYASCLIDPVRNLVDVCTDFCKPDIVFPKVGIVHVIYKSFDDQLADK